MEHLIQLRNTIGELQPSLPPQEIERIKQQVLTLTERLEEGCPIKPDANPPHAKLSAREREVMSMMLAGQRLKEIAVKLDISVKTVTTHRARLMRKLKVEDNLGLYRYGIRNGLISI